ncbi:MAG: N-glycosylase/DNA lyase [Candidatus Omnitrophota bacterium]
MKILAAEYGKRKDVIKERLRQFRKVWEQPERRVFSELCFCICTPQSKAVRCDKAVSAMERSGTLFSGGRDRIKDGLKGVRFPDNKAAYIVEARKLFTVDGDIRIKDKIDVFDIFATREWLAGNVKGIGMKESSHFLRNMGFGSDLAILDVHILKNMVKYGIIKETPGSISMARYLELEDKVRKFAKKIKIPMAELDLLFWSMETGEVFK